MSTRETQVPAIPDIRDDNVTDVLRAIKNVLQVREGLLGNVLDQYVTWRDLGDVDLVAAGGTSTLTNGTRVPVIGNAGGGTSGNSGYDPTTDLNTPPQPTGLTASASFSNVYLSWTGAGYANHAYTEIWRSTTDVIGNAVRIGSTISNVYADAAQEGQTYYYWIRFVSQADIHGPYNATSGVSATTATNPATIVSLLQGQITETQLFSSLNARINLIDGSASLAGSVAARIYAEQVARESGDSANASSISTLSTTVGGHTTSISTLTTTTNGLSGQYTVKIDNNGYVAGFGLASTVSNGTPTSIFMVTADKFAIANTSTSPVQVSSIALNFGGNYINTSSPHGFGVGDKVSFQNIPGYSGTYNVSAVINSTQFMISNYVPYSTVTASSVVSKAWVPFIVDSGKVYIDTAVIKDASISSAKINNLTADKITTGSLTAAINVNTGYIFGGTNPSSGATIGTSYFGTGYFLGAYGGVNQLFVGSPTQNLLWNGTSLSVKGTINALAGYIGQNIIDATGISSPNYVSGSTGWSVNKDGGAEFNNVSVRGTVIVGSSPAIDATNSLRMTGSGVRLYSDGKVVMGNATKSVVWNNSDLAINGMLSAGNATVTVVGPGWWYGPGWRVTQDLISFTVSRPTRILIGGHFIIGNDIANGINYMQATAPIAFLIEVVTSGYGGGSVVDSMPVYCDLHSYSQISAGWSKEVFVDAGSYVVRTNLTGFYTNSSLFAWYSSTGSKIRNFDISTPQDAIYMTAYTHVHAPLIY